MTVLSDELSELTCGWPVWRSAWQTLRCTRYLCHPEGECRHGDVSAPALGAPRGRRSPRLRSRHG